MIASFVRYSPTDAKSEMVAAYEASLELLDIWRAPPIPVVCYMGSGKPTQTSMTTDDH